MAAEDYIDWDALFEPIPPGNSLRPFKGRFARKIDNEYIEDHHFIGYCEVVRGTEKSILCRFLDDEQEDEQPSVGVRKWSQNAIRWIPRSQIADQSKSQQSDSFSLNPISEVGTKGNLWISGWLREKWDEEGVQL